MRIVLIIIALQFFVTFRAGSQSGWLQQNSPTSNDLYSVFCIDNNVCFATGNNGIIIKTTDGGANWNTQNSGIPYPLYSIFFTDINTGFASGVLGILLRTTNGGVNWNGIATGTTSYLRSIHFPSSGSGSIGYIAAENGLVLKTVNSGLNWTSVNSGSSQQFSIYCIDASLCYTTGSNGIYLKLQMEESTGIK